MSAYTFWSSSCVCVSDEFINTLYCVTITKFGDLSLLTKHEILVHFDSTPFGIIVVTFNVVQFYVCRPSGNTS